MSDDKNIKFRFQIDQQSFQSVKTAIQSLTSELQKLGSAGGGLLGGGNAFSGINIGGKDPGRQQTMAQSQNKAGQSGGGQQQTMGKVILDNANAFKKFAQEGKDASKIMTEALRRDIGEQERSLDRLQSKLRGLNEEFGEATKKQKEFLAAGRSGDAGKMSNYIQSLEGRIAEASGQTLQGAKGLAGSKEALAGIAPAGGGGFGGFMRGVGYSGHGFGGAGGGTLLSGIGKAIGGAALAATIGIQETMAGSRMMGAAEASRAGLITGDVRAMRGGDISLLQSLRMISRDSNKQKEFLGQQQGFATKAESYIEGVGGLFGDVLGKVSGGLSDKLVGRKGGAVGSSLTGAAQEDRMYAKAREFAENERNSAEMLNTRLATEYFSSTIGGRTQSARLRGLRIGQDKSGAAADFYGLEDARLTESGYSVQQKDAAYSALMASGGRSLANKLSEQQMAASAAGHGGFGEAVKAMAMASGGNIDMGNLLVRGGIGQGMNAAGSLTGQRMDVNAGFGLAGVLGGYDPRQGSVDPTALLSGFMGGIGGSGNSVKDMMNVQAFGGGLAFANQFTSGALDPLQRGKNTVFAANALGPGADSYAIDYLASMDVKKLMAGMGGNIDRTASNLGLNQAQFQSYGNRVSASMFEGYHGGGKIGGAVDRFKKSGKSVQAYLAENPNEIGLLADAMSLGSGGGMEMDTAEAFLKSQAGIGSGGAFKEGGAGGGANDATTKAALKAQANFKLQDATEVAKIDKELQADFSNLSKAARSLTSFGENLSGVSADFIKSLRDLTEVIRSVAPNSKGFKAEAPGKK